MTSQIQKQQKSKVLQRLLDALVPEWGKLQANVDAVFEQGRREGFDDMEIGDFIRSKMKEHYSQSTIQRVLPDSAKHKEFTNKAVKMNASDREPIDLSGKVSVEETQFNTEGMGVAVLDGEDDTEEDKPKELSQSQPPKPIPSNDALIGTIDILKKENKFLKEGLEHFKNDNNSLRQENTKLRKALDQYSGVVEIDPTNDELVNQIDELQKELAKAELANEDLSKRMKEYEDYHNASNQR